MICAFLDSYRPEGGAHARLIVPVCDRPGHDRRYPNYAHKILNDLAWKLRRMFEQGLESTVSRHLEDLGWREALKCVDGIEALDRTGINIMSDFYILSPPSSFSGGKLP